MEKIYLRTGYTDMGKELDGLIDIIQYSFHLDPYSNSLFLFCGKRADRIKAVHYEGDGFCLFYKRYENGHLKWPRTDGRRSQTDLPSAAPLAVGRTEPGAAGSGPQMGSPKARGTPKFLINTGKFFCFRIRNKDKVRKTV